MALRKDPTIARKVKEFFFMGGTNQYLGNQTPAAEVNIWVDPEAAKVVLQSGMPTTMVGWEICMRYAVLGESEYREIEAMRTKEAEFFIAVNRQVRKYHKRVRGVDATECPDSVTMSIVLDRKVANKVFPKYVEVDNQSELSRGATIVDDLNVLGRKPNVNVVYEASSRLFRRALYGLLRGEGSSAPRPRRP